MNPKAPAQCRLRSVILGSVTLVVLAAAGHSIAREPGDKAEQDQTLELSEEERRALEAFELETVVIKAGRIEAGEQTTAFGETLEVKEEATRLQSVTEVLSNAVGVQVRKLGGLGSYGAASIRGSTPSQVPVYLDGVLLNAGGFSVVDLGELSLDTLERIEVYRGFTPVGLGTAGIGGALHLKTRDFEDERTELALSAGSFLSFRLYALHGKRLGFLNARLLAALNLECSRGDFDYLNRNGTLFNPDDDRIQPRSNNDHRALSTLVKLDAATGPWRLTLAEDFHIKDQGVAGIDSLPTAHTRLGTMRNMLSATAERTIGQATSIDLDASWLYLHDDFEDTYGAHGELGISRQHSLATTHAVTVGGVLQSLLAEGHLTSARLEGRWERFESRELIQDLASDPRDRLRLSLGAGHEWNIVQRLFVQPCVRLEYQHNSFGGGLAPGGLGEMEAQTDDDFFWQASLGVRWEVLPGLTLQANGGRKVRTPDIAELFGDRGTVVGNPDLDPETGYNADAGVIWLLTDRGPLSLLRVEAAWFGNWTDDLIVYVQNSQSTVRSENVDAAEILGFESSLRLELWDLVGISANYTYLHAVNRSDTTYYNGKRLPGRPVHEVFGKITIEHDADRLAFLAWFDVDYAGQNYLTPANMEEDALARLLFGAGLRMSHKASGLSMTVEVKNLMDRYVLKDEQGNRRPLRDFESFPLPGRTVMATLHWRH